MTRSQVLQMARACKIFTLRNSNVIDVFIAYFFMSCVTGDVPIDKFLDFKIYIFSGYV